MMKSMKWKRLLAGILTTLMILEPGMEALAGDTPGNEISQDDIGIVEEDNTVSDDEAGTPEDGAVVSENDATVSGDEASVSENEAEAPEEEPAVSENEATPSENEVSGNEAGCVSGFRLYPTIVMYGEDGSNADGNLDAIFNPEFCIDDEKLELYDASDLSGDYTVKYKFVPVTEAVSFDALSVNSAKAFNALEDTALDKINAGTEVYVVALAEPVSEKAIAEISKDSISVNRIKIQKRKISLHFEGDPSYRLDSKSVSDDGLISVSGNISECGRFVIDATDGSMSAEAYKYAQDLLSASENSADIAFDLSDTEVEDDGWMEIPMEYIPDPEFDENFEIVGNIFGNVYTLKAHYYITFRAENNGQSKLLTYEIPKGTSTTIPDLLTVNGWADTVKTMDGIIPSDGDCRIIGWMAYMNGESTGSNLTTDFYYYGSSDSAYYIYATNDYYLSAVVAKQIAYGLYAHVDMNVYYDGREHILTGYPMVNSKTKRADLNMTLYSMNGDALTNGKDYTVSYKNNVNASMSIDEEGKYVPLYKDNSSRPVVVIQGKGKYKGFTADIYFEILPQDLGSVSYGSYGNAECAIISGLSHSYYLDTKGKLSKKVKIKVSKTYYYYTKKTNKYKVQLNEGKDYIPSLYRWNNDGYWEEQSFSDPNRITMAGDYLYMVRGTGNYCGGVYGPTIGGYFDDGKESGFANPEHWDFDGSESPYSYQFRVTNGDDYWNLENAKISIKRRNIRFDGKYHDASSFGVSVTIGKGKNKVKLIEGVHYYITYNSAPYSYKYTDKNSKIWVGRKSDTIYTGGTFRKANRYDFYISAIEGSGYFGQKQSKKSLRISGIRLRPNYFTIDRSSLDYTDSNSHPRMILTLAGMRAGLTTNSGSNYSVGTYYESLGMIPGAHYCGMYALGDGVDHEHNVERIWKRGGLGIQSAIKRGIIGVSFRDGGYNAGGSLPESITITYPVSSYNSSTLKYTYSKSSITVYPDRNNYKVDFQMALGDTYTSSYRNQSLTFKFLNNKKAGAGAKVTIKGGGVFKGKAKKNGSGAKLGYSVIPYTIEDDTEIPVLTDNDFIFVNGKKTQYIYGEYSGIYAVLNADEKGKNGAGTDRPRVNLYQAYYKSKKDADNYYLSLMPIKADQYKAVPGMKYGENAVQVMIEQNGNPLITGIEIGSGVSLSMPYTVYDSKAVIESAVIGVYGAEYKEYTVGAKEIPDIVFTGSHIIPYIRSVRLSDGTELGPDDVYAVYGFNVTAGSKSGSITIILKYNSTTNSFKYGGSQTFKFNITDAPKAVL